MEECEGGGGGNKEGGRRMKGSERTRRKKKMAHVGFNILRFGFVTFGALPCEFSVGDSSVFLNFSVSLTKLKHSVCLSPHIDSKAFNI